MKEAIETILKFLITIQELEKIRDEKNNFIKNMKYESAAKSRNQEKQLEKELPTLDELKDILYKLKISA